MCVTNIKRIVLIATVATSLSAWGLVTNRAQAETPRRSAALDLTPETFTELHQLIRPHDDEWRHLKVEWLTDVVAARKKSAREDKPIIICYTGGAGYNEPLGTC